MYVALPDKWRHRLITNIFASSKELQKSEKGFTPVLKNKKTGVFILKQPNHSKIGRAVSIKGGDAMK